MRRLGYISWTIPLLFTAACTAVEEPELCVFSADELAASTSKDPLDEALCQPAAGETAEEGCPGFAIGAEQVFFVRHRLPAGLTGPGKLEIHIATPCATLDAAADTTIEAEHVDGVVLLSRIAPRGAECSMAVTATIANSETRCDSAPLDAAACADLATVCAPPADDGSGAP